MKSLYEIFKEQVHSNELWRRAWEFSRFKRFNNLEEYKKRVSRKITKEDVPALIVTLIIGILVIVILSQFFEGSNLTYAISGSWHYLS